MRMSPASLSSRTSIACSIAGFGACLVGLGLLAGCGRSSPDLSGTRHDADQPTRGDETWMWDDVPSEDFETTLGELFGLGSVEFLAADHSLTKRTQFWLDRIDAQLRAAHPDELANVPKPNAKVMKESSANAFVAPVPICYKLPVKVRSGTANSQNTADTVYLELETGSLNAWPDGITCYEGEDDVEQIRSLVAKFNAAGLDCQYSVSSSGRLVPGSDCAVNEDLDGVVAAKHVAILQTANYVTVHTGLFTLMTEEAFASVLAHELGHYYRSHSTATKGDYGFFYTAEVDQPARRPVAEPERQELGDGAIMSSTMLNASDTHRSHPNATYRPELFFAAGSVVQAVCDAGSCPEACETAQTLIDSSSFTTKIGNFPFGQEGQGERQAYESFEAKVGACLEELELSETSGTLTATAVSWDKVRDLVGAPTWPAWLGQISPRTARAIASLAQMASARLAGDAPDAADLKAAFKTASATLKTQDDDSVALLRQAVSERLGYYTAEQEADDEAAEWIAETGVDPKHVVDAMRRLGQGAETSMHGMLLGEEDCDELRSNDWLGDDGAYVFVPIGDYAEVHHSVCYRMFNLEREIKAHGHETASTAAPLLTANQWRNLQLTAQSLHESLESGGGFSLAPIIRDLDVMSCPYANSYY